MQLREGGINTVLDLVRMDTATVRKRRNVTLERTVREVQGMPCIDLDDAPAPKQQIACTGSFGRRGLDRSIQSAHLGSTGQQPTCTFWPGKTIVAETVCPHWLD